MALHDAYGAQWRHHVTLATCRRVDVLTAVATGLLKINPDFFSIKPPKNADKETKFKPPNTSKINA